MLVVDPSFAKVLAAQGLEPNVAIVCQPAAVSSDIGRMFVGQNLRMPLEIYSWNLTSLLTGVGLQQQFNMMIIK